MEFKERNWTYGVNSPAAFLLLVILKKKTVVFVLKNTANLSRTDWFALFDLCDLPINSFCNKINIVTASVHTATKKLKNELKKSFPEVFSEGLGMCTKTKAKFEIKKNVTLVFKLKWGEPFAPLEPINKELDRLEKLGVI